MTVSGHPGHAELMMILPDADAYAYLFKCTLPCLHISIFERSMCSSLHGGFAFRVTGKDLKCLSFWPRDWNICKQESGKSVCIHIFRTIIVLFFPSRIVQSHLVSCCGWIVPAGQSCSATAVHDYSLWPLLPPSTNIGNCTESKYLLCECLTHPDVQSEYGESLQSFNRESHSRPETPLVGGLIRLPACIHINTTQSSQILILSLLICLLNTSLSMSNISLIGI